MIIPKNCINWINLQRSAYEDAEKEYGPDMEKEFNMMLPFLPKKCNSILDIGCGIAGIDILFSQKYNNPNLYLLDSNFKSSEIKYGFKTESSFYNSLDATKDMMENNNVKNYCILNINDGFPELKNIDIIISLLSWGYHYPVETYLKEINLTLADNGILILDIRENTNGIRKIQKLFPYIDIIGNFNKSARICARKI